MRKTLIGVAFVAGVAAAGPASAAHLSYFQANIVPLNNSGVSGLANLTFNSNTNELAVRIAAFGLEPNSPHPQHIHGLFDGSGNPIDSTVPGPAQDDDGDGFIELAEGQDTYGPIILSLTSPPGGALADFPTAPDGTIDFFETYNVAGMVNDLFPLHLREIVLHGLTVAPGVGAGTPGEVDGTGGYLATLPVAAGSIQVVPLPAAGWLLLSALAGLGLFGRRARRARLA